MKYRTKRLMSTALQLASALGLTYSECKIVTESKALNR